MRAWQPSRQKVMMSRADVHDLVSDLPFRLRERVEGYVATVAAEAPGVFEDAGVAPTPSLQRKLLFFAGVRKLWAIVDGNHALMVSSLELVEARGVEGMSVGASRYSRGSEDFVDMRRLRDRLHGQLLALGVLDVIRERTLVDLVRRLAEGEE